LTAKAVVGVVDAVAVVVVAIKGTTTTKFDI